jgi:hypothetical protein
LSVDRHEQQAHGLVGQHVEYSRLGGELERALTQGARLVLSSEALERHQRLGHRARLYRLVTDLFRVGSQGLGL